MSIFHSNKSSERIKRIIHMAAFAHITRFLLFFLATTRAAHGQIWTASEENSQANVTVISARCTQPIQDSEDYEFQFELSDGEKVRRDGRLREVNGRKEIVMTGYISEFVNGIYYRLRYAADENGEQVTVASREKTGILDRNLFSSLKHRRRSHFRADDDVFLPQLSTPPLEPAFARDLNDQDSPTDLSSALESDIPLSTPAQNPSNIVGSSPEDNNNSAIIINSGVSGKSIAQFASAHIPPKGLQSVPCTAFLAGCIPKMEKIFGKLVRDKTYDRQIRPDIYHEPTQVWADFHIRALLGINEVDMDFKMSVALTLDWIDPRLIVRPLQYPSSFVFPDRVLVGAEQAEKIWSPRVTVLNEKESVEHSELFDKGALVWDPYRGRLLHTTYGILTLNCEMSLHNFPMDTQICSAMIGSNIYGSDEIELTGNFKLDPIFSNSVKNMKLAGFGRNRVRIVTANSLVDVHQTVLVCQLLLKRHVGYYLIGTYFPAALVIIISWLTFWMPREGSAERMALGVTCVLTITTLLISSQSSSPKVSYVKAIDIYMGVCFGLVFTTLLQSTLIGHLLRKGNISGGARSGGGESFGGPQLDTHLASVVKIVMAGGVDRFYEAKILRRAKMSDAWSRLLFPTLFVAFNVAYWTYYGMIWRDSHAPGKWDTLNVTEIPNGEAKWFGQGEM